MKKFFVLLPVFLVGITSTVVSQVIIPQCNVQITSISEFGLEREVAFVANVQRPPGTSVSGSTFFVTFQNGDSRTFQGFLNSFGNPVARVPASCSNRITNVSVTVFVSNCGSDSSSRSFSPGICDGGGFGFN